MKLEIVIPALNEEESIEKIIRDCFNAMEVIRSRSKVTSIGITVVSDGSTDQTVAIAKQFVPQIELITFEKNKGYGAAIKEGWRNSDAELLGFIDADGTCNPVFFADLCNLIIEEHADIAVGCRMHPRSRMPAIRRFGNRIFSTMLSLISSENIRDAASGMRVVKRSSLAEVMPLPDGLHFTPAMSARAILNEDLVIKDVDMDYEERSGESKLKIWKDGKRFLFIILKTSLLYRPNWYFNLISFLLLAAAVGLMFMPTIYYLQNHSLLEWMIYRFIVSSLFIIGSALSFSAAYFSEKIVRVTVLKNVDSSKPRSINARFFDGVWVWVTSILLLLLGGSLVEASVLHRLKMRTTDEHWSRYIAMLMCVSVFLILINTKIISGVMQLIVQRIKYIRSPEYKNYRSGEPL